MDYLYKQKFSLRNQPFISLYGATALFVEPNAESRALYSRHLNDVHMRVITCHNLEAMPTEVRSNVPDIVIVNPSQDIDRGVVLVKLVKEQYPALPVITITETIRDNYLDAIMNAGVSLHINRRLTQPRDLLVAIEQALL